MTTRPETEACACLSVVFEIIPVTTNVVHASAPKRLLHLFTYISDYTHASGGADPWDGILHSGTHSHHRILFAVCHRQSEVRERLAKVVADKKSWLILVLLLHTDRTRNRL